MLDQSFWTFSKMPHVMCFLVISIASTAFAGQAKQLPLGRLVFESDASCELRIDGDHKGVLKKGEPRSFSVEVGTTLVECTNMDNPAIQERKIVELNAREKKIVTLRFPRN